MHLKLASLPLEILQSASFWQNHKLILKEFQHFRLMAIGAIFFSALASSFEGFGLGFLLVFLQSLTTPSAAPVKTGIDWVDIFILGVNTPVIERLSYPLSL